MLRSNNSKSRKKGKATDARKKITPCIRGEKSLPQITQINTDTLF